MNSIKSPRSRPRKRISIRFRQFLKHQKQFMSESYLQLAIQILGFLTFLLVAVGLVGVVVCPVVAIFAGKGHRRRWIFRALGSALLVPVVWGAFIAVVVWVLMPAHGRYVQDQMLANRAQRVKETSFVLEGDSVPEFAVECIDGQRFGPERLRGKVVLINFFATWCGPCTLELPRLQQIWNEHKDNENFVFLVIGREETEEAVRAYRTEYGYDFPMAADPEGEIYRKFASERIPRSYVIAPDGTIQVMTMGALEIEMDRLEEGVEEQLAAKR